MSPATFHPDRVPHRTATTLALAASLGLLSACSDGTGGGAGDGDPGGDPFTSSPSPVEPFVGVWSLAVGLGNALNEQSVLVIRPVDADGRGRSRVLIYELDTRDNCYFPPSRGRAVPDPAFRTRVFLENVSPFNKGELDLSGDTLRIRYFESLDTDSEQLDYFAQPIAITEIDIASSLCL